MELSTTQIKVALADDHVLLRNALALLIDNFDECRIVNQSGTGTQLIQAVSSGEKPDVIILDLNMPDMDGFETANWLFVNHPEIHILMLTMYDSELSLIRLLKLGVRGFLKKDIHPSELKHAIRTVFDAGFYYSSQTTGRLVNLFKNQSEPNSKFHKSALSDLELRFLKAVCSDLTYKEIAQKMQLNPRSIDTLRDQLFIKLDVKSRVGLAMVAIRHGIVAF